jgi:MerR family copper efflux transcriptional regulator
MERLTIGELARRGGVNLETIRYYERRGLLPAPARLASGYRAYALDSVRRVRFIKSAQELGFSLKEIDELLALRVDPSSTCAEVREHAEAKIVDIDEKIRQLTRMRESLVRVTATCSGRGPTSECPILDSMEPEEETV